MKVRALGILSGAVGDREKGDEFEIDAAAAEPLLARGLVEAVAAPAAPADSPAKLPKAKE